MERDRDELILENGRNVLVQGFETIFGWLILGLTGFFSLYLLIFMRDFSNQYGTDAGLQILWIGLILYLIGLFTLIGISQILKTILNQIL